MVKIEWKLLLLVAFLECGSMANAQLPNEKFGKPSSMEWDFNGWGDAIHADAIILCKTMKVTYQLSDQVFNNNQSESDLSAANIDDFGKNQIDESNILVNYEFRLRTKILKPEGAKHANIDITYFSSDDDKMIASLRTYSGSDIIGPDRCRKRGKRHEVKDRTCFRRKKRGT